MKRYRPRSGPATDLAIPADAPTGASRARIQGSLPVQLLHAGQAEPDGTGGVPRQAWPEQEPASVAVVDRVRAPAAMSP